MGALTPLSAGYVQAYRPTLLGLYIVWRLLLDGAQAHTPPRRNVSTAVAASPPLRVHPVTSASGLVPHLSEALALLGAL